MTYHPFLLTEELHITQIITIHYFEYTNTYHFHGESHDFWEFLCVDKGEVTVTAGEKKLTLQQGQIIFHEPNEFHNVQANGKIAPNLVVISFSCDSSCMKQFRNLITTISETEKTFLAQIIREARHCIATPLDNPFTKKMERRTDSPFASEQMIQLYLELLLLSMLRRLNRKEKPDPSEKSTKKENDTILYQRILLYMKDHLRSQLTLDQICQANLVGKSQLQKLFQKEQHCGVIHYFSYLKIEEAKQMIRQEQSNFTEISDALGYTSIHYFSRQFKTFTGMSPSEYAFSIKALSEEDAANALH